MLHVSLDGDGVSLVQPGFRSVREEFPGLGIEGEQRRFLEVLDVDGDDGPCLPSLLRLAHRDGYLPVHRRAVRLPGLFGPAAGKAQCDAENSK